MLIKNGSYRRQCARTSHPAAAYICVLMHCCDSCEITAPLSAHFSPAAAEWLTYLHKLIIRQTKGKEAERGEKIKVSLKSHSIAAVCFAYFHRVQLRL